MITNATLRILLADDDEDDQLMISSLFRQYCPEFQLICVENGHELVQFLEQPYQQAPSLILLDLNMPILSGFETLRYLKSSELFRCIPVIILTTSEEPDDIRQSYTLGANAFLTKPASHACLKDLVINLRNFWLVQAHLPVPANFSRSS